MWNDRRSIMLSRICVFVFMVLSCLGVIFGYPIIQWFTSFSRADLQGTETLFAVTCYSCAILVFLVLFKLNILLKNISKEEVFIKENVSAIRVCSWCCVVIASICFASAFYYFPFFLVGIGVGFMGLLLRVIKNIFKKAIILKEENELMI